MVRTLLLCTLATSAACSFGDDRRLGSGDAGPDSMTDGPPAFKDHLLLSEVKSTGAEFIEIWNPTNRSIDLSNYYLSDVGDYWRLPATPSVTPGDTDFLVRFPAGAMLPSRGVTTIATNSTAFLASYGVDATYSVDAIAGSQLMRDRKVTGTPQITNGGEIVILFYWDGTSDLIKDVDLVIAGETATTDNALKAKQPVDGPDADTNASVFKPDNGLLGGGMFALSGGTATSYKRRTLETGSETQVGDGNGITGDDETSEALKSTWDGDAAMPLSGATPGTVPNI